MAVTRANTTKDYTALAKRKIRKPRSRPLSILAYGRNKKGKTRFCTTAGRVLIADPEDGTDYFQDANPDVWPVRSWTDLTDLYKYLSSVDHGYDYVAFDGMTRFSNMALRFVMKMEEERDITRQPGMVAPRDYGKAGELMKGFLYNVHALPVGKIYTAQERQIDGEFGEEDQDVETSQVQYVPDLPKGIRNDLNGIVDVIGRLYVVRQTLDDDRVVTRHRMWLASSALYDTGYRSEYKLPDYLPNPTVPRLVQLINEGKVTRNGASKG